MNENITRRSLVVNLTEQEITDFSKELARITTLQAETEEEKKKVAIEAIERFKESFTTANGQAVDDSAGAVA